MGPVRDLQLRAPPATSVFPYASRSFRRRSTRRTHQSRAIPALLQSLSRSDTWRTRSKRRLRRHGPSASSHPHRFSSLFSLLASRGGRLRAQGGGGGREGERPCVPADIATKVLPHAVDPFPPARCLHVSVHGVASVVIVCGAHFEPEDVLRAARLGAGPDGVTPAEVLDARARVHSGEKGFGPRAAHSLWKYRDSHQQQPPRQASHMVCVCVGSTVIATLSQSSVCVNRVRGGEI